MSKILWPYKQKPIRHWPDLRRDHPLARGLVVYWPFWAGGGITSDLMGRHPLIHYNGPTWVASQMGRALLLDDASNQYLSRADACTITGLPVTISAWVNTDQYANQTVLSLYASANVYTELRLRDPADNDVIIFIQTGLASFNFASKGQYTTNEWFQCAGVCKSTTSRTAYLNGVPGTTNTATRGWGAGINQTFIGQKGDGTQDLSGAVAIAAIWNRALSDEEVRELYEDPWGLIAPRSTRMTMWMAAASAGGAPAGPPKFLPEDLGLKSINTLSGAA